MVAEPLSIVLVEDDDGHATLIQLNLERAGLTNHYSRLTNGQQALEYIRGEGRFAGQPHGSIVLLLDINMPKVDGIEVLRQLKADPCTNPIPVIMLTTTDDPREVRRCYELGCNVYITKPVAYPAFIEAIRRLGLFLQVVKVPPNSSPTHSMQAVGRGQAAG